VTRRASHWRFDDEDDLTRASYRRCCASGQTRSRWSPETGATVPRARSDGRLDHGRQQTQDQTQGKGDGDRAEQQLSDEPACRLAGRRSDHERQTIEQLIRLRRAQYRTDVLS